MLGVGFALQFGMGDYYVYAREPSPPKVAATSLTIFATVSFVRTLVAPSLGGLLVERLYWETTFLVYVGIGLVSIGLLTLTPDSTPDAVE